MILDIVVTYKNIHTSYCNIYNIDNVNIITKLYKAYQMLLSKQTY